MIKHKHCNNTDNSRATFYYKNRKQLKENTESTGTDNKAVNQCNTCLLTAKHISLLSFNNFKQTQLDIQH